MAKQKSGAPAAPSWDDFTEGSSIVDPPSPGSSDDDEDEEEELEEEPKKKVKPKKKATPPPPDEEEEEDENEEEEEEEEEEELKKKPVVKKPADPPPTDPTEEEEEEEEDDTAQASKFFEEVEKITGQQIDVDYGETDPLSPQGVALREKAVVESALDSWLEEVKTKFPQVFKALMHANNGGDPAELFTQTTGKDYTKIAIGENDKELAKEILRDYYKAKGVKTEAKIARYIEGDEESEEGIIKTAQAALAEMKAEQEDERDALFEAQKKKDEDQRKRDGILITAVDEVLESKKLGTFRITDKAEATQFRQFVLSNIRRSGEGKYEIATQVNEKELEKILQYQYFQFKKGDLGSIIQQKATTESANKLKLKLAGEQLKQKKGSGGSPGGRLSLKDF